MKLSCLLEEMEYECVQGTLDREITTLVYDSRKVEKDSAFVCISGAVCDGHDILIPGIMEHVERAGVHFLLKKM